MRLDCRFQLIQGQGVKVEVKVGAARLFPTVQGQGGGQGWCGSVITVSDEN